MKTLIIFTISILALATCQISGPFSKPTTNKPFKFNFNLPTVNTARPIRRYNSSNNEARYRANEGQYHPSGAGSGRYRGDNSGRYVDNSGQYVPDGSGSYHHTDNKYKHLGVGGGDYAHQGGDFEKYKGSKDHSPGDKYVGDNDKYKGYQDKFDNDKYKGTNDPYKGDPYSGDKDKYKGEKDKFPVDPYKGDKNKGAGTGASGNRPSTGGTGASGNRPSTGGTGASGNRPSTGGIGVVDAGGIGVGGPAKVQPAQGKLEGNARRHDDICSYSSPTNQKIIKQDGELEKQEYYYLFETENCMYKEEQSVISPKQEGSNVRGAKGLYYYVGPDGVKYTVTYSSDENGFIPQGDHIPTIPPLIARGLAYLKSVGKA